MSKHTWPPEIGTIFQREGKPYEVIAVAEDWSRPSRETVAVISHPTGRQSILRQADLAGFDPPKE